MNRIFAVFILMLFFYPNNKKENFSIKLSHSFYESLRIVFNEEFSRENQKVLLKLPYYVAGKLAWCRNSQTNLQAAIK